MEILGALNSSIKGSLDLFQYRFVWEKPSYTSGLDDGRIAFEDEGNKSYCRVSAVQIQGRLKQSLKYSI